MYQVNCQHYELLMYHLYKVLENHQKMLILFNPFLLFFTFVIQVLLVLLELKLESKIRIIYL
jgi:hypothetical protein